MHPLFGRRIIASPHYNGNRNPANEPKGLNLAGKDFFTMLRCPVARRD
jgi:hypothetical protein